MVLVLDGPSMVKIGLGALLLLLIAVIAIDVLDERCKRFCLWRLTLGWYQEAHRAHGILREFNHWEPPIADRDYYWSFPLPLDRSSSVQLAGRRHSFV